MWNRFFAPAPVRYNPDMMTVLEADLPDDLTRLQLPQGVADRLQFLLDRQDAGQTLTTQERQEAEGLVDLAEFLRLLRLRKQRTGP
jgi:hypothetical protein